MRYHRPVTPAAAAGLAAELEDVLVVGGGTLAVPLLARGRANPADILDLSAAGLGRVGREEGWIVLGATVPYAALATAGHPLLARMAAGVTGGPQIRNRGSVGGSACHANPASDVPAVLVALGARLRLSSGRESPASEFFRGAFEADLRPGEILLEIAVPVPEAGTRFGYVKVKHAHGSWPIATAAAVVRPDRIEVVLGGVAPVPLRWAGDAPDGWSDELADAGYRRALAPVVARRAVEVAA